jgi:hypothetical protein
VESSEKKTQYQYQVGMFSPIKQKFASMHSSGMILIPGPDEVKT